jgi:hypothetical protein
MGFAEVLTVIFITLKLTGVIDWSWWLVLLPEIIFISICIILTLIWSGTVFTLFKKKTNK